MQYFIKLFNSTNLCIKIIYVLTSVEHKYDREKEREREKEIRATL